MGGEVAFISHLDGVISATAVQACPKIPVPGGVVGGDSGIRAVRFANHLPSGLLERFAINGFEEHGGLEGRRVVVLNNRSCAGGVILRMVVVKLDAQVT